MEYGPRTRSSSYSRTKDAIFRTLSDETGETTYDDSEFAYPYDCFFESMHDVVVENFRSRRENGEIINNPMSKVKQNVYKVPSAGYVHFPYDGDHPFHHWYNAGETFKPLESLCPSDLYVDNSSTIQTQVDIAVTKAFAKIDSSTAALPVTLGELKETKEMLVTSLVKLRHLSKTLKFYRDKLKYAIDEPARIKFISSELLDAWMAVRFGWLPFASDLQNIRKAMEGLKKFEDRQTFRSGHTLTFQAADTVIVPTGNGESFTFQRTFYQKVNISAGVLCSQRYGGVPDTWGLTKIPGVIWELTRLSWAVDYFFNVADVIASFTPDSLWTPATAWVTTRTTTTQEVLLTSHTPWTGCSGSLGGGKRTTRTEEVSRSPNPTRGGINFRPIISWDRYIDLVGVMKSPMKKLIKETKRLYNRTKRRSS